MDTNTESAPTQMSLRKGSMIYLSFLGVWLLMFKLAASTTWFPNDVLIIFHLVAGFILNRWVLRALVEWHPHHATLNAVVKAKLLTFLCWPLSYAGLLGRLFLNKVL
tara:strand:- start:4513 stop:4833 length:321 start_codon:yes stop_codon:yes gene_type:complete